MDRNLCFRNSTAKSALPMLGQECLPERSNLVLPLFVEEDMGGIVAEISHL
jgi:hypothetical protein